jgi:hypothetical protein
MLRYLTRALPALSAFVLALSGCDPPVPGDLAMPSDVTVRVGETLERVLPTSDSSGVPLEWALVEGPETLALEEGIVTWTPGELEAGDHLVLLAATRELPGIQPTFEGLTVVVIPIGFPLTNHAPVAIAVPSQRVEAGDTLALRMFARDIDGDALQWSPIYVPHGAMLWPGGAFAWTPGEDSLGTSWVVLEVTDDGVPPMSDYVVFRIDVVEPVDHAPVFTLVPRRTITEACTPLSVSFEAMDPDGEEVTFAVLGLPKGAEMETEDGIGTLSWQPPQAAAGKYTATIVATDGEAPYMQTAISYQVIVRAPPPLDVGPMEATVVNGGGYALVTVPYENHACYTLSAEALPEGAQLLPGPIVPGKGLVFWKTAPADFGVYDIELTLTNALEPPGSVTETGRITVKYLEPFAALAGYMFENEYGEEHPATVAWTPVPLAAALDGKALWSHSTYAGVVSGTAFRTFERTAIPLTGVVLDLRAVEYGAGRYCGPGGSVEIATAAMNEPALVEEVPLGAFEHRGGFAVFDDVATTVDLALVHEDMSPYCKVDIHWDYVMLTPVPAY